MKESPLPPDLYYILENKTVRPAKSRKEVEQVLRERKHRLWENQLQNLFVSTLFRPIKNPVSPDLFQTGVFDKKGHYVFGKTYKTYAQAQKGHKKIIAMAQSGEIQ